MNELRDCSWRVLALEVRRGVIVIVSISVVCVIAISVIGILLSVNIVLVVWRILTVSYWLFDFMLLLLCIRLVVILLISQWL